MKLAIIGYGKMGKNIEQLAADFSFDVVNIFDIKENFEPLSQAALDKSDAEIFVEFTSPESAGENLLLLGQNGCKVVSGSTGWQAVLPEVEQAFRQNGGSFLHANNFSLGMQVFMEAARMMAEKIAQFQDYDAFLQEEHHRQKKDAPSGTARQIQERVSAYFPNMDVAATRAGFIVGRHRLGFDGRFEQLRLEHIAKERRVFAEGALTAAKWLIKQEAGLYQFSDLFCH